MITINTGNFLETKAEAIVNTVNCVGIMGKGIALQSKKAFPANYDYYKKACQNGEMKPGHLLVYRTNNLLGPKYIINFPTKRHWKDRSRYEDIAAGLSILSDTIRKYDIKSIAIPPLGCGLGGLDWKKVRPMITEAVAGLNSVDVQLFEPSGTPLATSMPVRTKHPRMTVARALLIKLIEQYKCNDYRLTLLEIQKLAYFLQESGLNLRLNYVKLTYGPYANNLNKVLEILEGHYIRGYGDNQKPDVTIELLPKAIKDANSFLYHNNEAINKLDKVATLVEGFETPYGMELLSSVHWITVHENHSSSLDEVIKHVHQWNERKSQLLKPQHIKIALDRLSTQGWIKYPSVT